MITATLLALDSAVKNYRHQEDSNFRGNTPNRFLIYRLNHSAMVPFGSSCVGIGTGSRLGARELKVEVLPGLEPGPLDSESRVLTN